MNCVCTSPTAGEKRHFPFEYYKNVFWLNNCIAGVKMWNVNHVWHTFQQKCCLTHIFAYVGPPTVFLSQDSKIVISIYNFFKMVRTYMYLTHTRWDSISGSKNAENELWALPTLFCQKRCTHHGTRSASVIFLKLRRCFVDAKPKKAVPNAAHASLSAVRLT